MGIVNITSPSNGSQKPSTPALTHPTTSPATTKSTTPTATAPAHSGGCNGLLDTKGDWTIHVFEASHLKLNEWTFHAQVLDNKVNVDGLTVTITVSGGTIAGHMTPWSTTSKTKDFVFDATPGAGTPHIYARTTIPGKPPLQQLCRDHQILVHN